MNEKKINYGELAKVNSSLGTCQSTKGGCRRELMNNFSFEKLCLSN